MGDNALYAQPLCTGTGPAGVWPPHETSHYPEASAADRAAFESTLAAVEQIVRKTTYATPHGYDVGSEWFYQAPLDRTRLSPSEFNLGLWCPSIETDVRESAVRVFINPTPGMWSDHSPRDEKGNDIYLELIRSATRFGCLRPPAQRRPRAVLSRVRLGGDQSAGERTETIGRAVKSSSGALNRPA